VRDYLDGRSFSLFVGLRVFIASNCQVTPMRHYQLRNPAFEPCIPTPRTEVPAGEDWRHQIKHDGFRVRFLRLHPTSITSKSLLYSVELRALSARIFAPMMLPP
jgi:hypothetical protein